MCARVDGECRRSLCMSVCSEGGGAPERRVNGELAIKGSRGVIVAC